MLKKELTVKNKTGLHARPASEFVKKASTFKSNVHIEFGDKKINAKSIVGLLSAGIGFGSQLTLTIEGEDEQEAMEILSALIEEKFEE
ncbi:MAG: HPr family phosphocarrier protein [Peptostreptococcaceae bacterium]|nr:HPr family phosphocarrier protein [Peptostreptococcaceae bacterium]